MSKKGQSENYDVLGGIFDFMFKEARKPADRRRPVIPKPGPTSSELLGDALMASLEKPGVFVNDTILREFNRSLDIRLGSVKLDQGEEIRLTTTGLVDLIKDPVKFVNKAVENNNAARKASRAMFLGEVLEDFMTTSWAYRYGNPEAKAFALANASANANLKSESFKVAKAIGQYARYGAKSDNTQEVLVPTPGGVKPNKIYKAYGGGNLPSQELDYMADRAFELLGRKTFGKDWDTLDAASKNEFGLIVSNGGDDILKNNITLKPGDKINGSVVDIQRYLVKKFGQATAKRFERAVSKSLPQRDPKTLKENRITVFNPILYKSLEDDNLAGKIGSLSGAVPNSPQEDEKKTYEKMRLLLKMETFGKEELKTKILDIEGKIRLETDPVKKNKLEEELRESRGLLSVYSNQSMFGKIGQYEGMFWAWRGTSELLGKNASNTVAAMLTGDFFDDKKNIFSPTSRKDDILGDRIPIAKVSKNKVTNALNKSGELLYYYTPRSLFNTFTYNGEGFRRLLFGKFKSVDSLLSTIPQASMVGVSKAELTKIFQEASSKQFELYIQDTIGKLSKLGPSGRITPEQLKNMQKLLGQAKTLKTLTNVFSWRFRLQNAINAKIQARLKDARVSFAKLLLKNKGLRDLLVKTGGNKLLGQWIAGGGIKIFMKSMVTAIAGAIGLVGTPLASLFISIGTWIATDMFINLLKTTLNVIKYAILMSLIFAAFIFLVGLDTVSEFNKTHFTYGYTPPGDVIQCPATNPVGTPQPPTQPPTIPPGGEIPPNPYVPPDPDAIPFNDECPVGYETYISGYCASNHVSTDKCMNGTCVCYDLKVQSGDPIFTTDAGVASVCTGYCGGYGNSVKITHTGPNGSTYYTRYAHLESVAVQDGQTVSAGSQIGAGDSTGNSSGPHLHYEVCGLQGGYELPEECVPNLKQNCSVDYN